MNASFRRPAVAFITVLAGLLVGSSSLLSQPERRIIPRHPYAIHLPELGRVAALPGACFLGRETLSAVGSVNSDSIHDWVASRQLCDSTVTGQRPEELLLYKGVRGGLPNPADRVRIGPPEINARPRFVTSGDWNADGHLDLCTSISIYGDTTRAGRTGIQLSSMVVWW